ncbi:MAG: dTDP-3-amino-3,6-dideoxy-alpha-D-galactopyranose transaminase [Candidatus Omnitrophica bacterium ADurb.Bin277]|nr:MAG: dTDP-3-amino-3,6-dideoxy-alpha-D-galactopyranose transaminase [Candidatus Omnitrophica bacterium ADurb.Bin277]
MNSKPKARQNNLPLLKVPYFDIKRQHGPLLSGTMAALEKVYASGAYILGPELKDFECKFAGYIGVPYAAGVASGTDALIFALKAAGVKKGDEVIVPSFTFTATALSVMHLGAIPVFADVDPVSFTLDPKSVRKAVSKKTKAMIPVHLFGQCANMDALTEIAKEHGLKIVEDACQAHGATWKGKKAGSLGDAAAFSFYPTKNLGGIGDGGMLTTQDESIYQNVLQLRNLGKGLHNAMIHDEIGWTSRLDSVQAAFLSIKLDRLDAFNDERRRLAVLFERKLKRLPLILPAEVPGALHVYHIYVVRVPDGKRNALKEHLLQEGIPSMVHYEIPVHRQPVMKRYKNRKVPLPVTEKLKDEVLTLPFYPGMTEEEAELVTQAVRKFYKAG